MDSGLDLGRLAVTVLVIAVASYAYAMAFYGRRAGPPMDGDGEPLTFAILVPCLDEAAVIGSTLATLIELRGRFQVLVVDDASDDDSVAVVRRAPARLVSVLQRRDPDARVGKGAALNAGYLELLRRARGPGDPNRVIVTVFDADSRIPPDFLDCVTPYFSDPTVVGVQSAVRMSNARHGWLTFWQDLEFVVWGRIFASAKDRLGSATLGGNGQCVRLSALMALGDAPWRPSLTEDLDLSLRLILSGGRIRFCGETFVAQEAVEDIRRLVRQRARWVQGHFVAWEHLGTILHSGAPRRVRLDLVAFLLLPATLVPLALATIDGWLTLLSGLGSWSAGDMMAWYALAFASMPLTAWALVRERQVDPPRAIFHAHLFLAYAVVWMTAAGRAVWSIMRGDRAWAKTSRTPPTSARAGRLPPAGSRRMTIGAAGAVGAVVIAGLLLVSAALVTSSTYSELTRPASGAVIVDRPAADGADPTGRPR